MNAVFVMENKDLEKEFLGICKENGMIGVKGHRSVAGLCNSLYNALQLESVQVLNELMIDFAKRNG